MKSESARAAAEIRKELKKNGIKGSVRCSNYSMGSSVRISLINPLPATFDKVKEFTDMYQYGSFNGMEDIYEMTNNRDDIPQATHVFVECDFSDEIKQSAFDWFKSQYDNNDQLPELYSDTDYNTSLGGWENVQSMIHQVLRGSFMKPVGDDSTSTFWTTQKPRI